MPSLPAAVARTSRRALLGRLGLGLLASTARPAAVAAHEAPPPRRAPRIGICLGSGALHGFAHIGAIRAFERLGVAPAVITGTSIGAVAGVLWAAGKRADEIAELARDPSWREANRWRLPGLGLARWQRLPDFIDRHAGALELLPTLFRAVATDLATGWPVVLDHGPAGAAVAASASVPIRFEPVQLDGRRLVDGALSAPVPVDAAVAAGAEFVIAIDVAYRPYEAPVAGMTDVAFQMFHILVNRLIDEQLARADFTIRMDVHALVGDDPGTLIDAGEQAVMDAWPALKASMAAPAGARQRCAPR